MTGGGKEGGGTQCRDQGPAVQVTTLTGRRYGLTKVNGVGGKLARKKGDKLSPKNILTRRNEFLGTNLQVEPLTVDLHNCLNHANEITNTYLPH